MKTLFPSLFILFIASNAYAAAENDCYQQLTDGFSKDSVAYHVWADFDQAVTAEDAAIEMVSRAVKQVGCTLQEIAIKSVTCKKVAPENEHSMACYIDSKLGYFFVVKDSVDTANVIFNRWD